MKSSSVKAKSRMFLLGGLIFFSSIGLLFRTFWSDWWKPLGLSSLLLVVVFLIYSLFVAFLTLSYLLTSNPLRSNTGLTAFLLAVPLVVIVLLTTLLSPSVDKRADRDEALEIAVRSILDGTSPWLLATPLDSQHVPTVLIGGIILAVPFVAPFDSSQWLSILVYPLAITAIAFTQNRYIAVSFGIVTVAAPITLNEIVFQSDIWLFAIIFASTYLIGARIILWSSPPILLCLGFGILVGMLSVVRLNFLFIFLPLMILVLKSQLELRHKWNIIGSYVLVTILCLASPVLLDENFARSFGVQYDKAHPDSFGAFGAVILLILAIISITLVTRVCKLSGALGVAAYLASGVTIWQFSVELMSSGSLNVANYNYVFYNSVPLALGSAALLVGASRAPQNRNALGKSCTR